VSFHSEYRVCTFVSEQVKFVTICRFIVSFILEIKMVSLLYVLTLAASVAAQKCPIQFDGRVPDSATLASFDTSASLYNPSYDLGASEYTFTSTPISRFI
jgi:hypothetical protein